MPVTLASIARAVDQCERDFRQTQNDIDESDSDRTLIAVLTEPTPISERIVLAYYEYSINKINAVLQNNDLTEAEKTSALQLLLTENWDFVKGTLLTYTALPDHPATGLWIKLAKYVSAQTDQPIISCLMPTLSTESVSDGYLDLTLQLSIRKLLRTHIISDKNEYPVPVSLLKHYDVGSGLIGRLLNPYFDFSVHPGEYAQLSTNEMLRLRHHSPETEALFNLVEEYHRLLNSDNNLLAKLQQLIQLMTANSVKGMGSEMIAGRGGMIAVLDFFTYYHALSPEELRRVPKVIRDELNTLLRHSTPQPVLNAQGKPVFDSEGRPKIKLLNTDIDACLALRSSSLKTLIRGNETKLHEIGLSESTQSARREALTHDIQNAIENIASPTYHGKEKLGFTARIISTLGITFSFADKELELFNFISVDEVKILFRQLSFAEQFTRKFNTVNELAYVLITWNATTIEAVFSVIGDRIAFSLRLYYEARDHFFHLISSLDLEKTEAVFKGLHPIMHRFTRCGSVPKDLFIFPEEHCKLYFKHTHPLWARELTSLFFIADFFTLQQTHLPHCRIAMTELSGIIQAQLPSLDALHFLRGRFIASLFSLFCEMNLAHISRFATDPTSFLNTFMTIPNEHKNRFLELVSPHLLNLIPTKEDLLFVLTQLSDANAETFLRHITEDQFNHYCRLPREKKAFCDALAEYPEKRKIAHSVFFPHNSQQIGSRQERAGFFSLETQRRPNRPEREFNGNEADYRHRFSRQ